MLHYLGGFEMRGKNLNGLARAMCLLVAGGIVCVRAYGTLIYQDSFTGSAGTTVGGKALDVAAGADGGTAGATWTADITAATPITTTSADAIWQLDGSGHATIRNAAVADGADANLIANAWLPFVPQAGFVYDLHIELNPTATGASGNWLGVAYTDATMNNHSPSGSASALSNDNPFGLSILKGSGTLQKFAGLGTANGNPPDITGLTVGSQFHSLDLLLDTSAAQWKMSWQLDGAAIGTTFTYASNPSIGRVVFGTNKLNGAVQNFSLSSTAVPEPMSLGALALAGLAVRRRRA
jgi:MYXO-CTERM domain-containing protein